MGTGLSKGPGVRLADRGMALSRSRRHSRLAALLLRYRSALRRSTALVSAATAMLIAQIVPAAAQVIADGSTATSIDISGTTTNVTTGSVSRGYGINSFSQFDVGGGQTVNIHAPGGTLGTVNIIRGSQSRIMGTVNGTLGGEVGGQLYLANPNGFVVGPGGVVRAGGVHISTPDRGVLDGPGAVDAIVGGSAALGGGDVTVGGRVEGGLVTIRTGGNLVVDGEISASDRAQLLGGRVAGGSVDLRAAGDITVGGAVRAEGKGGGDGGLITILADRNATLDRSGVVSAGAEGGGTGGSLEFSAHDIVALRGRLSAASDSGRNGTILIDPIEAVIDTNDLSGGGNIHIEATTRIVVNDGITLSSRDVGPGGNQLTGASVGDSGNISLRAPVIELGDGARILAHATDGFAAGSVSIIAEWPTEQSPIGLSSISATGTTITGGDVTIRAKTISHFAINYGATPEFPDVESYADAIDVAGVPEIVTDALSSIVSGPVNTAADAAQSLIDAYYNSPVVPGLSLADARVTLTDTTVTASGIVTIESKAVAESDFRGTNASLKAAVAATRANALTTIEGSAISTSYEGFDGLNIEANATTDVHVRAQTAAVSFSMTDSIVAIRSSQIISPLTRTNINAFTTEKQDITARQSDETEAASTVFSLRAQKALVLVDAEAGHIGAGSDISGNNISIVAQADREIGLDAEAEANGDDVATVGAVISVGSGRTEVAVGGDLAVDKATVYGGTVSLGAYADFNPYSVDITVRGGTFADTSHSTPPWGFWTQDWLSAVNALGTEVAEEGIEPGAPGTAITSETSYSVGLAADFVHDEVRTVMGGTYDGLDLGAVSVSATDMIFASAEWRLENMLKRTDVQSDAGSGGVATLSFGDWKAEAEVLVGAGSTLAADQVDLRSRLTLPTISPYSVAAFTEVGDSLGGVIPFVAPGGAPLAADDLMPDLYAHVHPEDFTFTNILGSGVDGAAAALDIAVHDFDLAARTIVDDGAVLDIGSKIALSAASTGSLLSRSVDPDAAGIQGAGAGVGGAIQVLRVKPVVEARLGTFSGVDGTGTVGPALGQVDIGATNGLLLATFGGARSNVDTLAVAGALSIVDYRGETHATLSGLQSFRALTTYVHAADQSILSAMAGGGAVGADGFGAAAGMVFADRSIVAAISDFGPDRIATGRVLDLTDASITVTYLTVSASDDSTTLAVAAAGGGTPGAPANAGPLPEVALGTRSDEYEEGLGEQTTDAALEGDGAGLSTGFAVAADYAGAFVTSRVVGAIESEASIATDLMSVTSSDTSDLFLSGGGTLAGSGNSGLGGTLLVADVTADHIALDRGGSRQGRAGNGWMTASIWTSDQSDIRLIGASRAGEHHRDAGLATAVFVTTDRTASATVEGVTYVEPVQLNLSATAGGLIFVVAGALAPEVADAAAVEEYDDGDPGNDPPAEPSADVAQPSGVSVGFTYVDITTDDSVGAGLVDTRLAAFASSDPDVNTTSSLDVAATNSSQLVTFATSLGAGGRWGLAGTAAVLHTHQQTDAFWRGSAGTAHITGAVALSARNSADQRAVIGAEADAANLSFGGSALILTDERETTAEIDNVVVAPNVPGATSLFDSIRYTVDAETDGLVLAFQRAGGGDGGSYGVAAMVGDVEADWSTTASIADSSLSGWMATVSAAEHGQIVNRQDGMASASSGAGAAGSNNTAHHSDVVAEITNSSVVLTSAMSLAASGDTIVTQRAVQSGTGKANGGAVHSHYLGDGEIKAAIVDSTIGVSQLTLTAVDRAWREIVANASTTPDAIGIAGGLTIDEYRRNTSALIDGGAIDVWRLTVEASSHTRTNNVALGRANGGTLIGVAAQVVWVVDDRDVTAIVRDADVAVESDTTISAERSDAYLMLQATASTSSNAVGIGAGVLRLGGDTAAKLLTPTALVLGEDLNLAAEDRSVAVSIGFGAAGGGAFSGVGSMSFLSLGRRPADATVLAENDRGSDQRDLSVDIRDDLAELLDDEARVGSGINSARNTSIVALLSVDEGRAEIGGDVSIEAVDSRSAVGLSGELRAGGVTGPLAYLDKYVRIESLTTDGIDFGYRNVDISAEGGDFGISVDFSKPWNPDADEGGGEEFPPGEEPLPDDDSGSGDDPPGSDGVGEYLDGTEDPLGEGMGSKGLSVGGALTHILLGGLVDAGIVVSAGAELAVTGSVDIAAASTPETIAIAAGSQMGQASFGASAALARQTELVRARIDGAGSLVADAMTSEAESNGVAWSIGALLAQADGISVGATFAINDLDASAETRFVDINLASDHAIAGTARETSSGVAVGFSGGAPGGSGFSVSTGANSSRSIATAYALGARLATQVGDIDLRAIRDQSGTGLVMALRVGGTINIGAAIAVSDFKGTAAAFAEDSELIAADDVKVRAESDSAIGSAAIGVAGAGSAGVSGSLSYVNKSDTTRAEIADSTVTAGDSVLVEAQSGGGMTGLGGGDDGLFGELSAGSFNFSYGGTAGVGVSLYVVNETSVVEALISGASTVIANGATTDDGVSAILRDADNDRDSRTVHGVAVIADNDSSVRGLALTVALAGTAAVSIQVPILLIEDRVTAAIDGGAHVAEVTAEADVAVKAANDTSVTMFTLVGAGASTAGIGADIEYLKLGKATEAVIADGRVDAGRDIAVEALSPDTVSTTSIAGAYGTTTGIAGVLQVAVNESATEAHVVGSDLVAGDDVTIEAVAPRRVTQTTVGLAAGYVGASGTILVYNARDSITASVDPAASANSSFRTTIDADDDVTISATADFFNDPNVMAGAGGFVGISGAILVSKFEQAVTARLGDHATLLPGRANTLAVRASQSYDQSLALGIVAGGAVGVGASVGYMSQSNTVLAEIGDHAVVDVSEGVTLEAFGNRSLHGNAISAGGGIVGINGAVLVVRMGIPSDHDATTDAEYEDLQSSEDTLGDISSDLEGSGTYSHEGKSFSNGDADIDATLGRALAGRRSVDLMEATSGAPDTIKAEIGNGAEIAAGGDITVSARETGTINVTSGGGAAGIGAGTGGVLVIHHGSTVQVALGDGVSLISESGDISLTANADVDFTEATAYAGNGGLVSLNGSVSNVESARRMSVLVGKGSTIETADGEEIDIRVVEEGGTLARGRAYTIGGVAIGGTNATARATSQLDIEFEAQVGNATVIRNGDVDIDISRTGAISAFATAAAGGIIAGNGATAKAVDASASTIDLGNLVIRNKGDDTTISIANDADILASSKGTNVAVASIGISSARAESSAYSEVVASGATIKTGELSVLVADSGGESDRREITADALSSGGGVISGLGGSAKVANSSTSRIDLTLKGFETDGTGAPDGSAVFRSVNMSDLYAESTGVGIGVVASGANSTEVISNATSYTRLVFDGAATIDGLFDAKAWGSDLLRSVVRSGSGGAVVVNAAHATLDARPTTTLVVAGDPVTAERIELRTSRTVSLDNVTDSTRVSIVGIGGSKAENDVAAEMTLDILADLAAEDISVTAASEVDKNASGYNGTVGEGGLLTGSSLVSDTDIDSSIEVTLTDATLTQLAGGADDDGIDLAILSVFDLADKLKIDTGGGLLLPNATSRVDINSNDARIALTNGHVDALGTVALGITTDAEVENAAYVNVYGLAGAPGANAFSSYSGDQDVVLQNGSTLLSRTGSVAVAAGTIWGEGQRVILSTEARAWNGTGLPLPNPPDASATIVQLNAVTISPTSSITAATDVSLLALGGEVDPYAYATSASLVGEAFEAGLNAFASLLNLEEVSLDTERGTAQAVDDNSVTVDGQVEAGAYATRRLHVGPTGTITLDEGDLEVARLEDVDMSASFADYLDMLEEELEAAGNNAALATRLEFEIARVEAILASTGGLSDLIVIDDVFAGGGNIIVDTEILAGEGELTAHGDVLVELLNQSEATIEVRDIEISDEPGGKLLFNSLSVDSNTDIAEINAALIAAEGPFDLFPIPFPVAAFDIDADGADGAQPLINIRNDFIQSGDGPRGDLIVTGNVTNRLGTVQLATADGDVMVLGGEIYAKTVSISSGGDFFLSAGLDELVTSVPDDPVSIYGDYFADYLDWVDGGRVGTEPAFELLAGEGSITAIGGVFIYADYLNIDGLIKSGVTDWTLDIAASLDNRLDTVDDWGDEPVLIHSGAGNATHLGTIGSGPDRVAIEDLIGDRITGNVTVRWDPVARELLLDPITTQGGYVELVGKIVSTGGGRIEAASGYGHLSVESLTDLPLVFNGVDLGPADGVNGEIKIVDLASPGDGAGSFNITRYVKEAGGNVLIYREETRPPVGEGPALPLIVIGDPVYEIADNFAITYNIGTFELFNTTRQEELWSSQFTETVRTIDEETVSASVPTNFATVDTYGETQLANNPYRHSSYFEQSTPIVIEPDWQLDRFDTVAGTDYMIFSRTVTEVYSETRYDSHRLAANRDIGIGFTGFAGGKAEISAAGTIYLDGDFRNEGGETNILSTAGSVLTVGASTLETALTVIEATEGSIGRSGTILLGGTLGEPLVSRRIGVSSQPMLVDLLGGRALELTARDTIRVAEADGNMLIRKVVSTGDGVIELTSPGSLLVSDSAEPTGALIRGGHATLTARNGKIGSEAAPMRVGVDLLTASASEDITITSPQRGLLLDTVSSALGDVSLSSSSFIRDGNDEASLDRVESAGLLDELWDEMGLRNTASGKIAGIIADITARTEADYQRYWQIRGLREVQVGPLTVLVGEPYDPDYQFAFTVGEKLSLVAQGLTLGDINTLEASRNAEYAALHARFGDAPYQASFAYTPTLGEVVAETRQVFWTDGQLRNRIRESVLLDDADTDFIVETANVSGHNVVLDAHASIGEQTGTLSIFAGHTLTSDEALAIDNAEPTDIIVTGNAAFVDVYEDVDVSATGTLTALADDNLLVSSEGRLTLDRVRAGGNARLKSATGLATDGATGVGPDVAALNVVLEGGTGGIGTLMAPVTLGEIGTLTARATETVALLAPSGDIGVGSVLSIAGDVAINAVTGAITDANGTDAADVFGANVLLLAQDDIGEAGNALDIGPTGLLSAIATYGDVYLGIPEGDATVNAVGALRGDTEISVADGDLLLEGLGSNPAISTEGVLTLNVRGSIVAPTSLVPQIAAGGAVFNVAGQIGQSSNYLRTAIAGPTSDGATFALNDLNGFASQAYIANAGHLSVTGIDLNSNGTLSLLNTGDLHLADGIELTGGTIGIATVGDGDEIFIDDNLTHLAGELTIVADGDLVIDGPGNIDFGDVTTLRGNRVVSGDSLSSSLIAMTYGDDLTIEAAHGIDTDRIVSDGLVTLRATTVVGNVEFDSIRAGHLVVSTYLGDVHLGAVTADELDITAHGNVDGRYAIAERAAIFGSAGIGIGGEDIDSMVALELEAGSGATEVELRGELGVNVRIVGTGTQVLTKVETAMTGDGVFRDGGGNAVLSLADADPPLPPEDLRGVGVIVTSALANLVLDGTGIDAHGTYIALDLGGTLDQLGNARVIGRDLSLAADRLLAGGPGGFVTEVDRLEVAIGAGAVHIRNIGDLTLGDASGAGNLDLVAGGTLTLAGAVTTAADVVLTARRIDGALDGLAADGAYFTALAGAIGAAEAPLVIASADVAMFNLYGRDGVFVALADDFAAGHVLSETGDIDIATDGLIDIGTVGTPAAVRLAGSSVTVAAYGAPDPIDTLPAIPGIILPGAYPVVTAATPASIVVDGDPGTPDSVRETILRRLGGNPAAVAGSLRAIAAIRSLLQGGGARVGIDLGGLGGDDDEEDSAGG